MYCFVADTTIKKKVEDVMPIATGHEREELEAELEVRFFSLLCEFCLGDGKMEENEIKIGGKF